MDKKAFFVSGYLKITSLVDAILVSTRRHFGSQYPQTSRLGGAVGRLGGILGHLGHILEASWHVLGRLGCIVGPS